MIQRNQKELQARYFGTKAIVAVYRGTRLVWQAIKSCFGAGWWKNEFYWKNSDSWKNIN